MGYHRTTYLLFALFLIGYGIQKYVAAAPPGFQLDYLGSVSLLTAMTALAPFVALWWVGKLVANAPLHAALVLAGGVALSMTGFALFWQFYIIPFFEPDPPFWDVVRRGLAPGLFISAILILGRYLFARAAKAAPAS